MLGRLRLARSRGSLQAPNSVVQDAALEVLDMVDERDRESRRIDTVKSLLTTTPMDRVKDLFPEYFQPQPADPLAAAYDEKGEFDIDRVDDSAIDWETPQGQQEDDDLSAWIEQQEQKNGGVTTFTANEWV